MPAQARASPPFVAEITRKSSPNVHQLTEATGTQSPSHRGFTDARLPSITVRTARPRSHRLLALAAGAGLLLSGCARFDDTAAAERTWQPAPELTPERGPQPELPEAPGAQVPQRGPDGKRREPIPPPQGCTDHDPAVIGTCLDTVVALAALPGNGSRPAALAAERDTGRVMRVVAEWKATVFATLKVDSTGDGGLTGLALSPSYQEDQLVFAYLTTATDNRVVRFAKGQQPKPILTGIPKGPTGNRGALIGDGKGALLVATGDAGDAKAAASPNSLAGKVLRIDTSGKPAAGNPNGSRVVASGLRSPGGVCAAPDGSRAWVTDRGSDADVVYRLKVGAPLGTPVWTWTDRPGVASCIDSATALAVATSVAGNLQHLSLGPDGAVTSKPQVTLDGKDGYGRLSGLDLLTPEVAVASTVNKDGGEPVSSDDRVVLIVPETAGRGGKD